MKKLVYSMFMFAMAAFTLAGCSDVPAPYGMPDGSDDEPTEEVVAKGTGTADDPFNVAGANKYISDGGDASADVYAKGKITDISDMSTSFGNCTYTISDDGNNSLLVYRGYGLNGEKFTTGDEIKVGDEVVVKGKLVNYNGTFEFTQGSALVSINGTGGGDEPGGNPETGKEGIVNIDGLNVTLTAANATAGTETITIDLSTLGYTNGEDVETITLTDGTTITFDKNGETNGPKYYDATNGVRVYKNNTITFNGKAAIANVVFTCDSYSGNDYVGNDTATLTTEGNTMVYTNVFTGTSGGGVQLRIKTITITYAK